MVVPGGQADPEGDPEGTPRLSCFKDIGGISGSRGSIPVNC
jgi:hypothetical protein